MNVNIALLTVTDTRTLKTDKSGNILADKISKANHNLVEEILKNDNYKTQQKIIRDKALQKKVDVNKFMEWFILNYPNSYEIIKENPNLQYELK